MSLKITFSSQRDALRMTFEPNHKIRQELPGGLVNYMNEDYELTAIELLDVSKKVSMKEYRVLKAGKYTSKERTECMLRIMQTMKKGISKKATSAKFLNIVLSSRSHPSCKTKRKA